MPSGTEEGCNVVFQAMEKTKNHSITSEELIIKFYFLIKEAIMDGASVSSANLLFYSKFKPRRQPKPRFCH